MFSKEEIAAWSAKIAEAEKRAKEQADNLTATVCLLGDLDEDPFHPVLTRADIQKRDEGAARPLPVSPRATPTEWLKSALPPRTKATAPQVAECRMIAQDTGVTSVYLGSYVCVRRDGSGIADVFDSFDYVYDLGGGACVTQRTDVLVRSAPVYY